MDTPSVPFDKADPISGEIVRNGQAVLKEQLGIDTDLNEALLVAYLAETSMEWHDDGEAGLGDTIVSHSFDANCVMK
jgi:alkylated DNA repair dioxygenase AlkB